MTSFETAAAKDLGAAAAFVERIAPNLEGTLVTDFKNAEAAVRAAITPVGDAAVIAAVSYLTERFPLNAPLSPTEIAFAEGVIAKLQALLPAQ